MAAARLLQRRVALPGDHGTWAFFLSPLTIGLAAGGRWRTASLYLVVAACAGFLLRQPLTITVKVLSGRRPRRDLTAALFWSGLYLVVALVHLLGLLVRGYGFVLVLAAPGIVVFCWFLFLVARRDERRQMGVEILGAGVLALSAPAALWVGLGSFEPRGWLLWSLCWIQASMSIVHVYARLAQFRAGPGERGHLRRLARPALGTNSLLMTVVVCLSGLGWAPSMLPLPFLLQWAESAQAAFTWAPAPRPTAIGLRQLIVSTLFTVVFIAIWR